MYCDTVAVHQSWLFAAAALLVRWQLARLESTAKHSMRPPNNPWHYCICLISILSCTGALPRGCGYIIHLAWPISCRFVRYGNE